MTKHDHPIDEALLAKAVAASTALEEPRNQRLNERNEDYDTIGRLMSALRSKHPSDKIYGQEVARLIPKTKKWDSTRRSKCLWLYQALNVPGSEGSDLFEVLNIDSLQELNSANPTVIARYYHEAKGLWNSSNPKRKRTKKDDSEPEPGAASSMPNKPLPRNVPSNGTTYEAHP